MMSKKLFIEPVRIDIAARDIYGTEGSGNTERLLDANFQLAQQGNGFIPENRTVKTPRKTKSTDPSIASETVNPWD